MFCLLFSLLVYCSDDSDLENNNITDTDLKFDDIAFGIWTGKKMLSKRVLGLAKTWLKLVPQIDVYSDYIDDNDAYAILNTSNHLNITFHSIPTFAHHLVGTSFDNVWNHAQSRHLIAFHDLYQRYPGKKWYFLGDDDTFLFPSGILSTLRKIRYDEKHILGHIFFSFPFLERFFQSKSSQYVFAQGGAGFFLSKSMMEFIAPHILNCSKYYEAFNFVSDIRIAACIDFYKVMQNISDNYHYYLSGINVMHGDRPDLSVLKETVDSRPISFHHIVPPYTEQLWNASFSTWTDPNGTELYIDWTHITTSRAFVQVARKNHLLEHIWGYLFYDDFGGKFNAITQLEPIFEAGETIPSSFIQKYEGDITMKYICDDSIPLGTMLFQSFLEGEEEGSIYRLQCEKPQTYMHNFPNGSPYVHFHEDQSDL